MKNRYFTRPDDQQEDVIDETVEDESENTD